VRVSEGRTIDDRWISPEAYSAFLEGTLYEARGDLKNAELAYEQALTEDPGSAEAWGRLGAVRCKTDPQGAAAAFEKARSLAPEIAGPWRARAECELETDRVEDATRSAFRAVTLTPNDIASTLLVARALERSGDVAQATVWLRALSLRRPGAAEAHRALQELAERTHDATSMREATERSRALEAARGHTAPGAGSTSEMDRELSLGNVEAAREAQIRANVTSADLAVHAAAGGKTAIATETAARVLAAEPGNVDARVAALAAADLRADEPALAAALRPLPKDRTSLGALAAELIRAVIARRVGNDAAAAFDAARVARTQR
jgi:tetratricopeptide (TPR) repeat protein